MAGILAGLKRLFNINAPDTPIDVQSSPGTRIAFGPLAAAALRHSDLLFLGDTDHDDKGIKGMYTAPENLKSYRQAGAKHAFFEVGQEYRSIFDLHVAGASKDKILKEVLTLYGGGTPTPELFEALKNDKNGTKEIFDELEQYNAVRKQGFAVHFADLQSAVHKQETIAVPTAMCKLKLKEKNPQACDAEGILNSSVERLLLDPQLAKNIRQSMPTGEKGILVYGTYHGNRNDDGLHDKGANLKTIKIEAYPNKDAYIRLVADLKAFNKEVDALRPDNTLTFGEDGPDAVYFMDTGEAYFSADAPPEFVAEAKKVAALESRPSSPAPLPAAPPKPP